MSVQQGAKRGRQARPPVRSVEERNELISKHIGLVYHIAGRFQRKNLIARYLGASRDELAAMGMLGLVKAGDYYEESRGPITACIGICVWRSIFRELIKELPVRLPEPDLWSSKPLVLPTVLSINRDDNKRSGVSEPYDIDGLGCVSEEDPHLSVDLSDEAQSLLQALTDRERDIVIKHVMYDETMHSIAEREGLSAQRVFRIIKRSIKKMRQIASTMETC